MALNWVTSSSWMLIQCGKEVVLAEHFTCSGLGQVVCVYGVEVTLVDWTFTQGAIPHALGCACISQSPSPQVQSNLHS